MASTKRKSTTANLEPVERRLFISGLHSSVTCTDLFNRFNSFGSVVGGIQGIIPIGLDANGFPKNYTFLTLESTESQLAKCTSLLSGSMWKGQTLRIALAKPDYHTRMQTERDVLAAEALKGPPRITKKRKRNPDPLVGEQARVFELVDSTNCMKHTGWNLEASTPTVSTPTPLFPLLCRPSHPLPLIPRAAPTAWTREGPRAKAKAARKLLRLGPGAPPRPPITRSKRMRIDVRRWGRKKIVFSDKEGASWSSTNKKGSWECVDRNAEVNDDGVVVAGTDEQKLDQVEWVFRAKDGSIKRKEIVQLTARSVPHADSFAALLTALVRPTAPVAPITTILASTADTTVPSSPKPRQRTLSPPPYTALPGRTLLYNEDDAFALLLSTQDRGGVVEARNKERATQLSILRALVGDAMGAVVASEADEEGAMVLEEDKRPQVEGFHDEEDDEEEEQHGVMRLRGGAGEESEEESSSSDDDDDDDEQMVVEEVQAIEKPKTSLQMGSLKDMFKPQEEAASFSMFSSLTENLDLSRTPSPEPQSFPSLTAAPISYLPDSRSSYPSSAFVPPPALGGLKNRSWIGNAFVSGPFFPFPSPEFEGLADGEVELKLRGMGLDEMRIAQLMERGRKERTEGPKTFWKSESLERIEEAHQKLQEGLRGQARKRHREASKRVRRKGTSKRGTGGARMDGDE